jgi:two-component system NarL family response regulator
MKTSQLSITILIAQSEKMLCLALAQLLTDKGFTVFTCHREAEVLPLLRLHRPKMAFICHSISPPNGLEFAINLKSEIPETYFVLFASQIPSAHDAALAFETGIKGYLSYHDAGEDLFDCVIKVAANELYISPSIKENFKKLPFEEITPKLTEKEHLIIELIEKGLRTKEIANQLKIKGTTVETHRKNIKAKLGIKGGKSVLIKYLHDGVG